MTITRKQVEALLAGCEGVTQHLCDCERGHNGLGYAGRICDCQAPIHDPDTIAALCTAYLVAEDRAEAAVKAEREACARVAYRVCAETRHVTLGDKVVDTIRARSVEVKT